MCLVRFMPVGWDVHKFIIIKGKFINRKISVLSQHQSNRPVHLMSTNVPYKFHVTWFYILLTDIINGNLLFMKCWWIKIDTHTQPGLTNYLFSFYVRKLQLNLKLD